VGHEGSVEVAIAILYHEGMFLMQLRDDIPGIFYPGHWALFGGHIEPGESSDIAVKRELLEEIGYTPPGLTLFRDYADEKAVRHVYCGALGVGLDQLVLGEGADMALLTPDQIRQGTHYSLQIQQTRPLGSPHQKILLDFLETTT
jgi:8-oxo-dGTP diphosphatase